MTSVRAKGDANGEFLRERQTELSDVIRARNKIQDRLLNVKLKYYEKEKDIRLNIIRREKNQIERVRASIVGEAQDIVMKRQSVAEPPPPVQVLQPEMIFPDWYIESDITEFESLPPSIRRHSTQ